MEAIIGTFATALTALVTFAYCNKMWMESLPEPEKLQPVGWSESFTKHINLQWQ